MSEQPPGGTSGDGDPLNRVFDTLRHPHRRCVLTALAEANPRQGDDFATDELSTGDEDPEQFRTELYHRHLPLLEEAGYVDWDWEADTFRRGPSFEEVAPLVELLRDNPGELPDGWP